MTPEEFYRDFSNAWNDMLKGGDYYYPQESAQSNRSIMYSGYERTPVLGQRPPTVKELKLRELVDLVKEVAPEYFSPMEQVSSKELRSYAQPYGGKINISPLSGMSPSEAMLVLMHEATHVKNRDSFSTFKGGVGESLTEDEHKRLSHGPFFGTVTPRYITRLQHLKTDPYWGRKDEAEANLMGGSFSRALFPEARENPNWRLQAGYIPAAQYVTDLLTMAAEGQKGRLGDYLKHRLKLDE